MRYVTGIRPTGRIHLGNYLGAIKQFREIKEDKFFFVADLHSNDDGVRTLIDLEKIGINAQLESNYRGDIFDIQHIISKYVGVGRLERMTQYKDKCETEQATLSLLSYPVLMAADIFTFKGTHIPVGSDQVQHIEFARDMSDILRYNGIGVVKPEAVLSEYPRIMSLNDGTKKMSKSINDGCIYIDESPDEIAKKIKDAKTGYSVNEDSPEMNNLRIIYKAFGGNNLHTRFKDFKEELTTLIIEELA